MRLFFVLTLLTITTAQGQVKLFELSKLESGELKKFVSEKRVVVIGEMHGTTEVPHFVLALTKLMKEENKPLTVALEINKNLQANIDQFLKDGDFGKLLKFEYFKYPDGRSSVAVGELIKGLREIKGIKITCFDLDSGKVTGSAFERDSLMGVNLNSSFKGEQTIIYTGNLHANLKAGYWRPNFKSAIYHFNKMQGLGDKLISLNTYFGGGTYWNCMNDGCKERGAGIDSTIRDYYHLENFIGVYNDVHPSGYSGFVYFDKITASKPLVN